MSRPTVPPVRPGFERILRMATPGGAILAKIRPGEYYVTSPPELITTLVGSCVAACIGDPERGVGGMNHFLLPRAALGVPAGDADVISNRYGDSAMENLIQAVLEAGGRRERLQVKIFGGGNMGRPESTIGQRNVRFVEEYLRRAKLTVAAGSLLGEVARKVLYEPGTGRAWVWKLPPLRHEESAWPAAERPDELPWEE